MPGSPTQRALTWQPHQHEKDALRKRDATSRHADAALGRRAGRLVTACKQQKCHVLGMTTVPATGEKQPKKKCTMNSRMSGSNSCNGCSSSS
eukprot:355828-Chlamydomonas_euryale.AAC.3